MLDDGYVYLCIGGLIITDNIGQLKHEYDNLAPDARCSGYVRRFATSAVNLIIEERCEYNVANTDGFN